MRPEPHPIMAVYQQALGIDSFALDGSRAAVAEPWTDRPHLRKSD